MWTRACCWNHHGRADGLVRVHFKAIEVEGDIERSGVKVQVNGPPHNFLDLCCMCVQMSSDTVASYKSFVDGIAMQPDKLDFWTKARELRVAISDGMGR